ncbi:MAG: hypothetical protein AB1486_12790 [Planctomycetota bacterium]
MRWCLMVVLLLFASGCALVYQETVVPLDTNFDSTPVFTDRTATAEGDVKRIDYYLSVEWDSNAIGDIARREGFETVYYADIETVSVLGIWNQRIVHIYGK